MPTYIYECAACVRSTLQKCGAESIHAARQLGLLTDDEYESQVLFETYHGYEPTPAELAKAVVCPRCHGTEAEKAFYNLNVTCYIRGDGFLDMVGAHRDMNLHTLVNNDPYAEHRVPGEVDDMKVRIKKAGQHDPKPKHFVVSDQEMTKAVTKAVHTRVDD